MTRNNFVLPLFGSVLSFALLLAGCGDPTMEKAKVEEIAQKQLSAIGGQEAPPITCPGDLTATVGTTMTCAIDLDGQTYDVNLEVTKADGVVATFEIEVADTPR
jgi:hypothetical protein